MSDLLHTHLPSTMSIRELLDGLLGREVTLEPGAPLAPSAKTPTSIATYVDDSLQLRSLIVVDLPFGAYAGAALGLIPVGGASDAIESGSLPETMAENLYEVLNIAASLFNVAGAAHLRLYQVHHAGTPLPADILARALTLGRREDLKVEVAGYGAGRLSIVLL